MNPFKAFVIVAGVSAASSLLIVFVSLRTLGQISDGGMWAIAAMTTAPAFMAIGVSHFISRTPGGELWRPDRKGAKQDDLQ
jgi:hypothetical protein